MSQLIHLGQCEVNGGQVGDPQRVANLVGNRPHWLGDDGLKPDRFPEISSWPKGQCQFELACAHFSGEKFSNFVEARECLRREFADWGLAGFPELMSDKLWKNLPMLWECGIWRVYAPAPEAVWLGSCGYPCAPYVGCDPDDRHLSALWVESDFCDCGCCLLSRKVEEELGS